MPPNPILKGLKIAGAALGAFLALFLGMFLIFGKGFSGGDSFLASLSSAVGGFLSREEPIAEVDLASRSGGPAFHPCVYGSASAPAGGPVIFNEIAWMGMKEDYNAEWMELKNVSGREANISLWQIINADERIKITIPKGTVLPAGGFNLLVRKASGKISGNLTYDGALVNTGTGLRLFTADCGLADEVPRGMWPAGDNETKRTMERTGALKWQTSSISGGTPGGENSSGISLETKNQKTPAPQPLPFNAHSSRPKVEAVSQGTVSVYSPVAINEVFVGEEGASDNEYIEIWNPSDAPASLTGWSLKKRSGTGAVSSLVSASRLEGKTVPAKGFLLLANEGGYRGGPAPDAAWAKSNTLAYSNNAVLFVNPKGEVIQEVSWTEIQKGKSFSRNNDGNFLISEKTPKLENK